MRRFQHAAVLVLLGGCSLAPSDPPGEVASRILEDLEAERTQQAADRFDAVANDERYRQVIFPVVYEAAGQRYRNEELKDAAGLLEFLNDRYPQAAAPREALLYALFIQRAGSEEPNPDTLARMETLIQEIRALSVSPPGWVDLAAAQNGIDRGRLSDSREAYARFRAEWSGDPPELAEYVTELGRYLETHGSSHDEHANAYDHD